MTQTAERMVPLDQGKMGPLFDRSRPSGDSATRTSSKNQESQVGVPDIAARPEALCRRV